MRRKTVQLRLTADASAAIAEAVAAYANAAYPPGGSECAQVSRETLLDSAKRIATAAGNEVSIRKRHLPMLRAAINWYYGDEGPAPDARRQQYAAELGTREAPGTD